MDEDKNVQMSNCPFCGGYDVIANFTEGERDGEVFYQSGCCDCAASGPEANTVDAAAKLWNDWCKFHTSNDEHFPPFDRMPETVRPLTWSYELVTVFGKKTNAVEIYFPANRGCYEVPGYPGESLSAVSLTRAEIKEILRVLDDDIAKLREHCPDAEFF